MQRARHWWEGEVIYQLLVPSFYDTDSNGWGDLRGIIERLDHLEWLGVRGVWLSPCYPSPLRDMGYDVSNYCDIHPLYGTLADFDELIYEAHRRHLKIILDWVPNHTSDEHPWFIESRASRDNPRRDWYLWADPKPDGSPPNNWISNFGGSVWEWDEATEQYYLHTFLKHQPDLNWRNEEVQRAMLDVLRFWLDRGTDGFRVDAISLLVKDDALRDNPPNPDYRPGFDLPDTQLLGWHTMDLPLVHDLLVMFRRLIDQYDERLLSGELYLAPEKLVTYYGTDERPELHLPFNLLLPWSPWTAESLAGTIERYERELPVEAFPLWTLNTHDCLRFPSRVSPEQVRVSAMLLYTMRGTLTQYYGEEIGMLGTAIPPEQSVDPQGRRTGRNRDPARTPMQWDDGPQAGFTTGDPWLPLGDCYRRMNVAAERNDPHSLLSLHRALIALRRSEPVLRSGVYQTVEAEHPRFVYRRADEHRTLLVALNLGSEPTRCRLAGARRGRIVLATGLDREGEGVGDHVDLIGDEGVIVAVE